jgi:hypothetical protein
MEKRRLKRDILRNDVGEYYDCDNLGRNDV